jgi:hypothetical protein
MAFARMGAGAFGRLGLNAIARHVSVVASKLLLRDGSSRLLLRDNASFLLLGHS